MRILIVYDGFPMFDRNGGDFRLMTILRILSRNHDVHYHGYRTREQMNIVGIAATEAYRQAVADAGAVVEDDETEAVLQARKYDIIFFEFYVAARRQLHKARYWQPDARIIIDTVDVHFKRLFSQAAITGEHCDLAKARRMKKREISAYRAADVLLAVTEDDRLELLRQNGDWRIEIIPSIHAKQPLCASRHGVNSLIFVGGFNHAPNVDAVIYFCRDVLPLLTGRFPDIALTIVGSYPPPEVQALASNRVKVTGYVPDTKPYLLSCCVSIAPLRFGAGMKTKLGEAMSYGLPVVTTTVGMEGFGLASGEHLLVGDTPEEFAAAVARLLDDRECYETVRRNGQRFIESRYSCDVVSEQIHEVFTSVTDCPRKKIGMLQRMRMELAQLKKKCEPEATRPISS